MLPRVVLDAGHIQAAAVAKKERDTRAQKECGAKIKSTKARMSQLEKAPELDKAAIAECTRTAERALEPSQAPDSQGSATLEVGAAAAAAVNVDVSHAPAISTTNDGDNAATGNDGTGDASSSERVNAKNSSDTAAANAGGGGIEQPQMSSAHGDDDDGSDDDGGLSFDTLFESTAATAAAAADEADSHLAATELEWSKWPKNYEYSSWSGMAPRDLLFEWCRKNKKEKQPPRYSKHAANGKYKYSVKVPLGRGDPPLEYTPPIAVNTVREAQDLCATLALYELAPEAGFHRRLPPPLRNLWLQRRRDAEANAAAEKKSSTAPRDEFVQELLAIVARTAAVTAAPATVSTGSVPSDVGDAESRGNSAESGDPAAAATAAAGEAVEDGGDDSVADDWDASSGDDGGGNDGDDDAKRKGNSVGGAAAATTGAAVSPPAGETGKTAAATQIQPNQRSIGSTSSSKRSQTRGNRAGSLGVDMLHRGLATTSAKRILKDQRSSLPAYRDRIAIVDTIQTNQITVISGETGCGKSTQVPQLVLQRVLEQARSGGAVNAATTDTAAAAVGTRAEDCHIICTQPRRISAISIACRVSDELGQPAPGGLVGYKVRMESKVSDATKLEYCTTGVLLRRLQNDPQLAGVSHVVIDEVHERSVDSDFLMLLLRRVLPQRPTLRVVLMSATLDADKIAEYFGGCPVITIPGRTFPVQDMYLEDVIEQTGYVLEPDSEYALAEPDDDDGYSYSSSSGGGGGGGGGSAGVAHDRSGAAGKYNTAGVHLGGATSTKSQLVTNTAVVADSWDDGNGDGGGGGGDDWDSGDSGGSAHPGAGGGGGTDRSDGAGARARKEPPAHVYSTISRMDTSRINYELIEQLIVHVDSTSDDSLLEGGSILVFMPGLVEITRLYAAIMSNPHFYNSDRYHVIALHSSVAAAEQRKAFESVPAGHRKIVISTNIAETGVTIPDCVVVIDAGKVKEMRHREDARMSMLVETFISAASAKQRAGRAGRVRPGVCYRMYTRDAFSKFPQYTTPEILRTPLEALSLHILASKRGSPQELLATALDPPTPKATANAIQTLGEVGALLYDAGGAVAGLSPLGQHLSRLPVHVKLGKMLIFAAVFGCLDPALTIAAAVGYKSPFVCPFGKREAADKARRSFAKEDGSDLLGVANAYAAWTKAKARGAAAEFTRRNFLSTPALDTLAAMRDDLRKQLGDVGLWSRSRGCDANAGHKQLLKAVVLAGMYPSVAQLAPPPRSGASPVIRCGGGGAGATAGTAQVHPSSAIHHRNRASARGYEYVAFAERVKTSQVFLRDVTVVSPAALLLFGGTIDVQHQAGLVTLDTWIKLQAPAKTAVIFKELRAELDELLLRTWETPQLDFSKEPLVRAIADVLAV